MIILSAIFLSLYIPDINLRQTCQLELLGCQHEYGLQLTSCYPRKKKQQHLVTCPEICQGKGYRLNGDIMTGKKCRQFILLIWTSFIGWLAHPVGGGNGVNGIDRRIVILASYEFHFILVHEILV